MESRAPEYGVLCIVFRWGAFMMGSNQNRLTAIVVGLMIGGVASTAQADDDVGLTFTPRFWYSFIDTAEYRESGSAFDTIESRSIPLFGGSFTVAPESWDGVAVSATAFYGEGESDTRTGSVSGGFAELGTGTLSTERLDLELLVQVPANDDGTVNLFMGARSIITSDDIDTVYRDVNTNAVTSVPKADADTQIYLAELGLGLVAPLDEASPHVFFANGMVLAGFDDYDFSETVFDGAGNVISTSEESESNGQMGGDVNLGYGYYFENVAISGRYRLFILTDIDTRNNTSYVHGPELNASIQF